MLPLPYPSNTRWFEGRNLDRPAQLYCPGHPGTGLGPNQPESGEFHTLGWAYAGLGLPLAVTHSDPWWRVTLG